MPTSVINKLEDLRVLRPDLERPYLNGFALFGDGDRVEFTYRPSDDDDHVTLYKKARENERHSNDRGNVPNPRSAANRVEAIRQAAEGRYDALVAETRAAEAIEVAENERREGLVRDLHFQKSAGPLLFAVLERLNATTDIADLLDDEPELASEVEAALAAGRGVDVKGNELPLWQFREIGAQYWSVIAIRAPDADTARRLATLELRDGRDKFHNPRHFLPEEVEVRVRVWGEA